MSLVTAKLTADDVRKAVELFWATFLAKSEEELMHRDASGKLRIAHEHFSVPAA
jgi:hypothetical protein